MNGFESLGRFVVYLLMLALFFWLVLGLLTVFPWWGDVPPLYILTASLVLGALGAGLILGVDHGGS